MRTGPSRNPDHPPPPRPPNARTRLLLAALLLLPLPACHSAPPLPSAADAEKFAATAAQTVSAGGARRFHLGFTPWPYDFDPPALAYTRKTVQAHGDLVLFHLDNGVPWPEALAGQPFPQSLRTDLDDMKSLAPGFKKVYVSASPLAHDRINLALYWSTDTHQPLPSKWKKANLDDPDVIRAYTNYCLRLIEFFHPDYFAYAIEVNGGLSRKHKNWPRLLRLVQTVYRDLKAAHPALPIFLSLQTAAFNTTWDDQWEMNRELVQHTDLIGMSTYPIFSPGRFQPEDANVDYIPPDWFSQIRTLAPQKPWAITETGYIAEDLNLKSLPNRIRGSELWQARYVQLLLAEAQRLEAEFVVWFVVRDYDKGMKTLEKLGAAADAAPVWKDMGLFDGEGRPRPALQIWDAWLRRPPPQK